MKKRSMYKKVMAAAMAAMVTLGVTATGVWADKAEDEKVVINFMHRWPDDPKNSMFQQLADEYMEENPNVEIKIECVANDQYKEKIRMLVNTDDIPDIFTTWSDTFAQEMVNSGNILSLDSVYEEDTDWSSKIAEASIKGFTLDGVKYGVPFSQDGKAFFYNKKVFEENNLEIPETWDEFIKVLDALKEAGYEMPLVEGLPDSWAVLHYLGTLNQRIVDPEVLAADYNAATGEFTDEAYVTALEKWKQLTEYMGEECLALTHETARTSYFSTGQVPIMYLQFAEITNVANTAGPDFEFGFFNFPTIEDGKGDQSELTGAPEGYMLSNKAENQEECIKFLKFLTSQHAGEALTSQCGELSSVDGAVHEDSANEAQLEALEIVQNATKLTPWFDNACDPAVYTVYGQGAQAIAAGDETPESVMESVQEAAASLR